jgi:hypothetical protein
MGRLMWVNLKMVKWRDKGEGLMKMETGTRESGKKI